MAQITFSTNSGGRPIIPDGLDFLVGEENRNYDTVRNGYAYRWGITFEGEVTGLTARYNERNWKQYQAESGITFWYSHRPGNAYAFDSASILKDIDHQYRTDEIDLELGIAPENSYVQGAPSSIDSLPGGIYRDFQKAYFFDGEGNLNFDILRDIRWAVQEEFVQSRGCNCASQYDDNLECSCDDETFEDSHTFKPFMRVQGGWIEIEDEVGLPTWLQDFLKQEREKQEETVDNTDY